MKATEKPKTLEEQHNGVKSQDPSLPENVLVPLPRRIQQKRPRMTDQVRKYRADYKNNPPSVISFMSPIASTSGRLHSEFIRLLLNQWASPFF